MDSKMSPIVFIQQDMRPRIHWSEVMTPQDQFISRLYRSTQQVSISHFRDWALKELQSLIHFDSAIWSTGHLSTRSFHTHTALGLPQSFTENLIDSIQINPITKHLYQHLGEAIDMADVIDDSTFYNSDIYQAVFKPNKIERILSSVHINQRSGIYTLLSIYRSNRVNFFTDEEKKTHQSSIYHLIESASHSCMLSLNTGNDTLSSHAICDNHGMYHEVDPSFLDLVDEIVPNKKSQCLPFELPEIGKNELINNVLITTEKLGDLFRVNLRNATPLDRLTKREAEVVNGVTQGMSFKQIAKRLDRSPSTVSNHLYRIYQKLNINNRSELADLIQNK